MATPQNQSSAPGFLTPIGPPVPYDDDLVDLLQPIVAAVGGYADTSLVRPRWQPGDVPNMPGYTENWVAFGIARTRHDVFAYEEHVTQGAGLDVVERSEELDVQFSFYGPLAGGYAGLMRDGMSVEQNRSALNALEIELIAFADPVTLPALLTGVWVRRVDMTMTLRRKTRRQYGVLTVVGLPDPNLTINPDVAELGLNNEQYVTPIVLTNEP